MSTPNLSVTIKTFKKILASCSFGCHVEGKIVPFNMATNTNQGFQLIV